ncbi:MAG: hypothetical protein QW101_02190 [Ignisphaera sp.]|uniref:Uncharacterized protein n=1 Tax=Ignisphaera aggregans TaxID=334771 RepID=A0A7J3MYR1_9CREN
MTKKVKVYKTIGDYVALVMFAEDVVEILNILQRSLNKGEEDVEDAIRMINYFDTFYNIMKKKFKEYLTPKKNVSDIIRKRVLIDKIKLIKIDETRMVEVILDRSISLDEVLEILVSNNIEVEKA